MRLTHKLCTVVDCGIKHKARGYCPTHYAQWFRGEVPSSPIKTRDIAPPELCTVPGCTELYKAKGLCSSHYANHLRHGHYKGPPRTKPRKFCNISGCDSYSYIKDECHAHYQQTQGLQVLGLTRTDYNAIYERQGGVCAICEQGEKLIDSRTQRVRTLAIDHNHDTGKVRGLLCAMHNRGLGFFGDSIEMLEKALSYLKQHA